MSYFDNVEQRSHELNPEADEIMKVFNKVRADLGATGVIVTVVEGMTDEEEEMAIFAGYLKEGYSPEEAAVKAKKFHAEVKEANLLLAEMPRKGMNK